MPLFLGLFFCSLTSSDVSILQTSSLICHKHILLQSDDQFQNQPWWRKEPRLQLQACRSLKWFLSAGNGGGGHTAAHSATQADDFHHTILEIHTLSASKQHNHAFSAAFARTHEPYVKVAYFLSKQHTATVKRRQSTAVLRDGYPVISQSSRWSLISSPLQLNNVTVPRQHRSRDWTYWKLTGPAKTYPYLWELVRTLSNMSVPVKTWCTC